MFGHILVPVDLDDEAVAAPAMAEAVRLAARDTARLSVVSVVPHWPDDPRETPGSFQPKLDAFIDAHARGRFADGIVKVGGSVAGRIEEVAEEIGADLIVMASHDPKISDYLIGSNAAHVVLHTPCSVLVVRPPARTDEGSGILVPVDLEAPETADKAMAAAAEMARQDGASITVVSVQPIAFDETGRPPPDYRPRLDAYVAAKAEETGCAIKGLLKLGGSVSGEIRYAAEETDTRLIVMATHEPHLRDYVLGSNAAHVALHTACSVLVVR